MYNNITVIIPIFNEKLNIELLLVDVIKLYYWINILVINDGSTDWVEEVFDKNKYANIKFINNDINKWLTYSIIKWINNCKTDYFIVMDWDFQHPVKNIINFINAFWDKNDIVVWNRQELNFKNKRYRKIISIFWIFLVNLKLKKSFVCLKDPLTWFFWGKTKIYKKVIDNNNDFYTWWYKFLFNFLKYIDWRENKIFTFEFVFWERKYWKSKLWFREYINFIKSLVN